MSELNQREKILRDAIDATVNRRGSVYGPPAVNLGERTAALWNAYLENRKDGVLSGADVCNLMILLKVARLMESENHYDSWLDIAGYAASGWEVAYADYTTPVVRITVEPSDGGV